MSSVIAKLRSRKILPSMILAIGLFSLGTASLLLLAPISTPNGENVSEPKPDCIEPVSVNYPAPQIKLTDLGMSDVHVVDYLGDVVLLNTWATWCPPCRAEMPDLQTYYEKYQEQGFALIGVNIGDSQEQVLGYAIENELTFPLWLDPNETSLRAFNTISLPHSIVIDREGTVLYAWSGATCISALENKVSPLIVQ